MQKTPSYKDRKKLNLKVKQEFQQWLLAQVLVAVILSAVIAAIILYFYARNEVVDSFFDAHVKIRRVSDLLLPVIAVASAVSLCAGSFLALFLPQKIAGPIYRIEADLRKVEKGDLTAEFRLRSKDTLQDFAGSVATAVGSVREKIDGLKEVSRQLEEAVSAGERERTEDLLRRQDELLKQFTT